jgi:hypothetical protein
MKLITWVAYSVALHVGLLYVWYAAFPMQVSTAPSANATLLSAKLVKPSSTSPEYSESKTMRVLDPRAQKIARLPMSDLQNLQKSEPARTSPFVNDTLVAAQVNVAESHDYDLLKGFSMDISKGHFALQTELEVRVKALDELKIYYPFSLATAMRKREYVYIVLLIDELGNTVRMQPLFGQERLYNTTMDALEKVRFTPGIVRGEGHKSLLLLEFEYAAPQADSAPDTNSSPSVAER